jgi:YggT family protein
MSVFYALLAAALEILGLVLNLFIWVLIFSAILSWLIAFDVVNPRSHLVQTLGGFAYRVTEPLLRPIRRFLPPMGGIDLSPLVLILLVMFLQSFLRRLVFGA